METPSFFCCPVCGEALAAGEKTYACPGGHCFDRAKQGYVNLLCSQQSSQKRHGDDKLMARARQAFLDKGFYRPLLSVILDAVRNFLPRPGADGLRLLDAGCGEGWYTAAVREGLRMSGLPAVIAGIDISRETLQAAARRFNVLPPASRPELAVASVNAMPVASGGCAAVLNFFTPCNAGEFARVLRPDGVLIRAVPLAKHLHSLKAAIYDAPRDNAVDNNPPPGFQTAFSRDLHGEITLETPEDIANLFMMTPYYYKTSRADQAKAAALTRLTTETAFGVRVYIKG